MKKLLILILACFATTMFAQQQATKQVQPFYQIVQNDSNQYRLLTYSIETSEFVIDTFVVSAEPAYWMDSIEFVQYSKQLINASAERQEAIRQLLVQQSQQTAAYVNIYESFAGEGAILTEQKQAIENAIQGDWKLFRRVNEEVVQKDVPVSISGTDITMRNRSGTVLVNDDLTFTISGIFAANIIFRVINNGVLRADVGKQTIVLRK